MKKYEGEIKIPQNKLLSFLWGSGIFAMIYLAGVTLSEIHLIKSEPITYLLILTLNIWTILFTISMTFGNVIILQKSTLLIPIRTRRGKHRRWLAGPFITVSMSKKKIPLEKIENIALVSGEHLYEQAEKTNNEKLWNDVSRHQGWPTSEWAALSRIGDADAMPFLYIQYEELIELFNVKDYPEKKLLILMEELKKRNIKTEINLKDTWKYTTKTGSKYKWLHSRKKNIQN